MSLDITALVILGLLGIIVWQRHDAKKATIERYRLMGRIYELEAKPLHQQINQMQHHQQRLADQFGWAPRGIPALTPSSVNTVPMSLYDPDSPFTPYCDARRPETDQHGPAPEYPQRGWDCT